LAIWLVQRQWRERGKIKRLVATLATDHFVCRFAWDPCFWLGSISTGAKPGTLKDALNNQPPNEVVAA
jgi:hypothetical protein